MLQKPMFFDIKLVKSVVSLQIQMQVWRRSRFFYFPPSFSACLPHSYANSLFCWHFLICKSNFFFVLVNIFVPRIGGPPFFSRCITVACWRVLLFGVWPVIIAQEAESFQWMGMGRASNALTPRHDLSQDRLKDTLATFARLTAGQGGPLAAPGIMGHRT